jgi:hypothetical protein
MPNPMILGLPQKEETDKSGEIKSGRDEERWSF